MSLVFFPLALDLVSHFVWKCRCLSSKPENKQLAASTTLLSQQDCSLEGVFAIDAEIVLGGVPCLPSPESFHFFPCLSCCSLSAAFLKISSPLTHFFSFPISLLVLTPLSYPQNSFFCLFSSFAFAFGGVASCSVVCAHPISPLPCQC